MKNSIYIRAAAGLFLILAGCTAPHAANTDSTAAVSQSAFIQAKVAVTVSQGTTTIYSDSNPGTIQLTAGQQYNINLNVQDAPAGTTYSLVLTDMSMVVQTPTTIKLNAGDNSYTAIGTGNYKWVLSLQATGYNPQTRQLTATVQCPNPNFSSSPNLNAADISVTAGSGTNLYNFSALGVTADAGGTGPYTCAWDLTGVGIQDTGFSDCTQTLKDQYVNYVGTRNIGLIVMDSCGNTANISNSQDLAYTLPSAPGNVFITGQTGSNAGTNPADPRYHNVTYLATNDGGNNIVIPSYSHSAETFSISAYQNYGQNSSVNFGVEIQLQGFKDSLNTDPSSASVNASATIDTTGVSVKSIVYKTDQSGDAEGAVGFNDSNCSLSNVVATVKDPGGQPCTTGNAANFTAPTVEVSGSYNCSMASGNGATMNFAGTFDGYDMIADNCTGGGQGGGGVVPQQF